MSIMRHPSDDTIYYDSSYSVRMLCDKAVIIICNSILSTAVLDSIVQAISCRAQYANPRDSSSPSETTRHQR